MKTWTQTADRLVPFLREVVDGGWSERPGTCPHCGVAGTVHLYFDRNPGGPLGTIWAWCSSCRRYEHGSIRPPSWWQNLSSIDRGTLVSSPEPLDEHASEIDAHWSSLGQT